jgi:hypothetical protein
MSFGKISFGKIGGEAAGATDQIPLGLFPD